MCKSSFQLGAALRALPVLHLFTALGIMKFTDQVFGTPRIGLIQNP